MPLSITCAGTGAWISVWHLRTGPLAADVALDREHARGVVELLAHVLADALHRAAAAAHGLFRLMAHFHARQVRRQRAALRLCSRRLRRLPATAAARAPPRSLRDRHRSSRRAGCAASPCNCSLRAANFQRLSTAISCVSLLDLELLVLQLAILAGECFDQVGGEFAQLLRVHPRQLIVHLHAARYVPHRSRARQQHCFTRRECVACAPMRHHGNPITSACNCSRVIVNRDSDPALAPR